MSNNLEVQENQVNEIKGLSKRQQKLKLLAATKDKQKSDLIPTTEFRKVEKYFKSKVLKPNYDNCLDFNNLKHDDNRVNKVKLKVDLHQVDSRFKQGSEFCYTVPSIPGLIVIPGAFNYTAQKDLLKTTLAQCLTPPYINNLNTHYELPTSNLLDLYIQNYKLPSEQQLRISKKTLTNAKIPTSLATEGYEYTGLNDKNEPIKKSSLVDEITTTNLMKKLRWVTFGSQYHWPTKTYLENLEVPVPKSFNDLSKKVVEVLNLSDITINEGKEYFAEAGVINFYQLQDSLMGHIDKSEPNLIAPLISYSFGLKCVFLIGSESKETVPLSIVLNSGDILIMSGQSRLAYHGVPRIIEESLIQDYLQATEKDKEEGWDIVLEYLKTTRINLNFRQVRI